MSGLDARAVLRRDGFVLDVVLRVAPGEVVAVLGPNGAGKSTLLQALAGLVPLTSGHIRLDGRTLDDAASGRFVTPPDRPVGMVFQDYRLFPHLSVRDNVAFAPRSRGMSRAASRAVAHEWLERLAVADLAGRRPRQLSGGQAQRVAVARALAGSPGLLLLDEPLAALDARTRLDTQRVLREHLAAFDGPALLVTHDPLDALLLANRLVVVEDGRVRQDADPAEVASRPATEYVARLVGVNLLRGHAADGVLTLADGTALALADRSTRGDALAVLRPSAITVYRERPPAGSARNVWPGRVDSVALLTDRVRVHVSGRPAVIVDVTPAALGELNLVAGREVWLSAKATDVDAYQPG